MTLEFAYFGHCIGRLPPSFEINSTTASG